jgi:hypothetical protein
MREKNFINKYDLEPRFVLKLISTFIGQNKELFFMHACVEKGCSASLCIAHEKKT